MKALKPKSLLKRPSAKFTTLAKEPDPDVGTLAYERRKRYEQERVANEEATKVRAEIKARGEEYARKSRREREAEMMRQQSRDFMSRR